MFNSPESLEKIVVRRTNVRCAGLLMVILGLFYIDSFGNNSLCLISI